MTQPATALPPGVESIVRCGPGDIARDLRRGDLILVRGPGLLGRAIRLGGWWRYRSIDLRYAYWSHAALVVTAAEHLIEVHVRGVGLCGIEKYRAYDFCHVRLAMTEDDRMKVARYAYAQRNTPYDVLGFVALGISVTLGDIVPVPDTGKPGCVSLIARALGEAGIRFDRPPQSLMPADLARRFGVLP